MEQKNTCCWSFALYSARDFSRGKVTTLWMKGRWESNINVWFPCMFSQKWHCYFQNRIIIFCLPVPTLVYICESFIYFQDRSACSAQGNMWTDPGNILIAHRHVNVKIAAQFPEKEYINGIFVAVYINMSRVFNITTFCVLYLSLMHPKCCEILQCSWPLASLIAYEQMLRGPTAKNNY